MQKINSALDTFFGNVKKATAPDNVKPDIILDLLEEFGDIQTNVAEVVAAARAFNADQEQQESTKLVLLHVAFSGIVGLLIVFGGVMVFASARQNVRIRRSNFELNVITKNLTETTVSREYLYAAINNIPQALCMVDDFERIIIWNDQFVKLFGIKCKLVSGISKFGDVISVDNVGNDTSSILEEIYQRLRSAAGEQLEGQFIRTTADKRIIESSLRLMPSGWVVTFADITERKLIEEDKNRAFAEVDAARGRAAAAQAESRAKSAFLAMMSHEIRTPMNAVIGLSSSLLEANLDQEQHYLARTIYDSSNSLLGLLNDILDISKLEEQKVEFEAIAFSPASITADVMSIMGPKIEEKGLTLISTPDESVPQALLGDPTRIRQVLLNLVGNAAKFTETGTVEVATRCLSRVSGMATIEFSVHDSGIGIPSDRLSGLFQYFTQADDSINRRFGGTGLGLAISKRIIEQMGGEINVKSAPGVGSTFSFKITLPISDMALTELRNDAESAEPSKRTLIALVQPLRILLAEDSTTNQLVVRKLLQEFKVQFTIANNGHEAVDLASSGTFDVIFMDLRMPEMDGLEATRRIRAIGGALSSIPIIALTANAFAEDVNACRAAGMSDFVAKPIRKNILVEKLAMAVADRLQPQEQTKATTVKSLRPKAPAQSHLPIIPPATVAMTDVASILNPTAFKQFVQEIGAEGARLILDVFFAETLARLELLRRLSHASDRDRIETEAHTVKGASGTFGLIQVSTLAATLEHGAHSVSADEYRELLDRLDASFKTARAEVENTLATVRA
ncbi:MAG TPA: ATP-binding protein [Xanthobacteraceae bacterium]|nr:ATP-binding protein [Xanthobacteraceae bacterium]